MLQELQTMRFDNVQDMMSGLILYLSHNTRRIKLKNKLGMTSTVLSKLFPRVPLSQCRTCTRTIVTIQNMYTYHCHNTEHVHVPLSQCRTCTRTTVTIQNMYTYNCHNKEHVHVPLSQYRTCTRTTVTIQNHYYCKC